MLLDGELGSSSSLSHGRTLERWQSLAALSGTRTVGQEEEGLICGTEFTVVVEKKGTVAQPRSDPPAGKYIRSRGNRQLEKDKASGSVSKCGARRRTAPLPQQPHSDTHTPGAPVRVDTRTERGLGCTDRGREWRMGWRTHPSMWRPTASSTTGAQGDLITSLL